MRKGNHTRAHWYMSNRIIARSTFGVPVIASGGDLPRSIVWMPQGDHEISAGRAGGGSWSGTIRCDELAQISVELSRLERAMAGQRVWIDCNHDNGAATADVHGFKWDPALGIVAKVTWTPFGEQCLTEKRFCSFSPTFWVDEHGRPSGLVQGLSAGGLVNAPAFGAAMPRITATAREQVAHQMRQALLKCGHCKEVADTIAQAVENGASADRVGLMITIAETSVSPDAVSG